MGKGINNPENKECIKVSYVGTPEREEITTGGSGGREGLGWSYRVKERVQPTCESLTSLCEYQGLQLSQHGTV